jgi:hypothetical protein
LLLHGLEHLENPGTDGTFPVLRKKLLTDKTAGPPKRPAGRAYLSPARFFPSSMTLRKIRLMRVW